MKNNSLFKNRMCFGIMLLFLEVFNSCNSSDTSLNEANPRKTAIYKYASSLCLVDERSSTMSSGVTLRDHPFYLKDPFPTRIEMEQVIGKADFSQMEKWTNPIIDEVETLTLYWWEKDRDWETPTAKGRIKGYREIIIAHFDEKGFLRVLECLQNLGFETIGRFPSEWSFISNLP